MVELATAVVLVAVQQRSSLVYEMLSAPALVRLGTLSYGIYLWHDPVVLHLRVGCAWAVVVLVGLVGLVGLAISMAVAAWFFYTVERWALR